MNNIIKTVLKKNSYGNEIVFKMNYCKIEIQSSSKEESTFHGV